MGWCMSLFTFVGDNQTVKQNATKLPKLPGILRRHSDLLEKNLQTSLECFGFENVEKVKAQT